MLFKWKEKENPYFQKNENIFSIKINSYKEKYIERNSEIFYNIQITDNFLKKTWYLDKSIIDFQNLYEKIFLLYSNIPLIPKKTVFKITSLHTLDKRKYELLKFLKFCFNRKDILLNKDFLEFVEMQKNNPKYITESINEEEEIQFDLSVKNFIYIKDKEILIILCTNTDFISSDEISLDNILLLRNNFSGISSPLSYIFIYKYKKENKKFSINKLWEKSFFVPANILQFDDKEELLFIGNDEGKINIFKTKIKGNFQQMENYGELSFHNDKITGLNFNAENYELFSCSMDCMLFVSNLKDKEFTKSLIYNNISGFTGLKYIKNYNFLFASDEDGFILVFYFNNNHFIFLMNIQTKGLDKINTMILYENYIFTGGNKGTICILDITNIKKKEIKEIKSFNIDENKINCLIYNSKKDEIIIGNDKGIIILWNNKINNYIYSFKAHFPFGIQYLWIDEKNILWSSGNDKKIKKWKIPEKWFNEDIYLYSHNLEEKKNKKDFFNLEGNDDNISSDEDELNGWSKNLSGLKNI